MTRDEEDLLRSRHAKVWAVLLLAPCGALAGEELKPAREVAPGVFVREGEVALASAENLGAIANAGFIVGEEAVAVIDPGGGPAAGRALLAELRAETDLPVRYVIYTHMHPDHTLGIGPFLEEARRPEVVAHADLPHALAARAEHYLAAAERDLGPENASGIEVILPDLLVEASLNLDLGERPLALRAWPTAHTNNDLTILDEWTGTLFAGDLLFMEHLPVIDGSIRGWVEAHESLAALPAERVVPGHGPASAPWPEALAPQRAYLESLAAASRALIREGAPLSHAVEAIPAPSDGWLLTDAFHRRNVTAAYAELEWE